MMFDVHYWDPPWSFTNKKTGGTHTSGAVQKYPTMDLGAIQALPVASIAAPSSALFLWCPTRLKFSHGYTTAIAWGFNQYETTVYWDKQRLGMGFWYRNTVEELLVFTRGWVVPFGSQLPNIIHHPVGEHSEKPEAFRRLIEDSTGKFSRRQCLEGFARQKAIGWTGIGNMITGNDIRKDIRLLAAAETVPSGLTVVEVKQGAEWPTTQG